MHSQREIEQGRRGIRTITLTVCLAAVVGVWPGVAGGAGKTARPATAREIRAAAAASLKLARKLCRALVYRGWWLTGATMSRYQSTDFALPDLGDGPPLD